MGFAARLAKLWSNEHFIVFPSIPASVNAASLPQMQKSSATAAIKAKSLLDCLAQKNRK